MTSDNIVAGVLANAIRSLGETKGLRDNGYNTSLFEPFINDNFEHASSCRANQLSLRNSDRRSRSLRQRAAASSVNRASPYRFRTS